MKLLPETKLMAYLCTVDMVGTLWGIRQGIVMEAGPVMSWALRHGVLAFVFVKIASFVIPLVILERLKERSFVRLALTAGIIGYVAILGSGCFAHAVATR